MSNPGTIENNGLVYKPLGSWEGPLGSHQPPTGGEKVGGDAETSRRGRDSGNGTNRRRARGGALPPPRYPSAQLRTALSSRPHGAPGSRGSPSPPCPPPSEMRFKKGVPRAPRNTEAGPERAGRARGCRKLNRDTVRDTRWADLAWARAHAELTSEVVV